MNAYLISYDLNSPGKNYDELYKSIKSFPDYCSVLKSEWLVASDLSEQEISDKLKEVMDKNDMWFVCKVVKGYYGWLSNDIWNWLLKYV